jgi:hypothetical protein
MAKTYIMKTLISLIILCSIAFIFLPFQTLAQKKNQKQDSPKKQDSLRIKQDKKGNLTPENNPSIKNPPGGQIDTVRHVNYNTYRQHNGQQQDKAKNGKYNKDKGQYNSQSQRKDSGTPQRQGKLEQQDTSKRRNDNSPPVKKAPVPMDTTDKRMWNPQTSPPR